MIIEIHIPAVRGIALVALMLIGMMLVTACGGPASTPVEGSPTSTAQAVATLTSDSSEATTKPAVVATDSPVSEQATTVPLSSPSAEIAAASPTEIQATLPPSGGNGDALDAIFHAMSVQSTAKSFRSKIGTRDDAGKVTILETIESIPPDRSHVMLDAGEGITSEYIIIGDTTYSRSGDAAWEKLPSVKATPSADSSGMTPPKTIDEFRKSTSNARVIGSEDLDGIPTVAYQLNINRTMTVNGKTTQISGVEKIWVAVSDGLPRREDTDQTMEFGGHSIVTKGTVLLYDYGADIKIEAPIP